jgi:peptidoglycan/LPS O-acetylase OafA/YrhL
LFAVLAILVLDTVNMGGADRFRNIVRFLLIAFVVARYVFLPTGLAATFLNSGPLIFIGKLSYSLYLWQELFLNPFSSAWICTFPWNVFATFGAASLSYFVIEAQFLKLRKRFRRTLPVAEAAEALR